MEKILEAIQNGASGDQLASIPLPTSYRAAHVRKEDEKMWEGIPSNEKDPRKSLRIGEVPLPEHWGGFLVTPDAIEVWREGRNRMHDRFRYTRTRDGWTLQRIWP